MTSGSVVAHLHADGCLNVVIREDVTLIRGAHEKQLEVKSEN